MQRNTKPTLTQEYVDKNFKLLKGKELMKYPIHLIGNDPIITVAKSNEKESSVLIATSGLRAIELACKLAMTHPPTIILIDKSSLVCQFWKDLKVNVENSDVLNGVYNTIIAHAQKRNCALIRNSELTANAPNVKYHDQNGVVTLFRSLISEYGAEFIKEIITGTIVIPQSWEDKGTFEKLKKLLSDNKIDKIFMYPSNLLSCIANPATRQQILKNIRFLNPTLTIHTDTTAFRGIFTASAQPTKVHMVTNQDPEIVNQLVPFVKVEPYVNKQQLVGMLVLMLAVAYYYYSTNSEDQHTIKHRKP